MDGSPEVEVDAEDVDVDGSPEVEVDAEDVDRDVIVSHL